MRRALAALALLAALAPVGAAAQPAPTYDILSVLLSAVDPPVVFRPTGTGEAVVELDPAGDLEHSSGEEPGIRPSYADLTSVVRQALIEPGPELRAFTRDAQAGGPWCAPDGFGSAGDVFTACPLGGRGSRPGTFAEQGGLFVGVTLDGPVPASPGSYCEFALWIRDAGVAEEDLFQEHPQFPNDPADGTNRALGIAYHAGTGWFTYAQSWNGEFFDSTETGVLGAVHEGQVGLLVPTTELANAEQVNYATFCSEGSGTNLYDPSVSATDQTGPVAFGLAEVPAGTIGAPGPSSPTASPTVSPSPTTSPSTGTPSPVPSEETGGSFMQLVSVIVIVVGGIIIVVGVYVYWPTRERGKPPAETPPEQPTEPGGGASSGSGGGDSGGPTVMPEPCDWEVRYDPGGGKPPVVLRRATGHACCVYTISIRTGVHGSEVVAGFRQEGPSQDRLLVPTAEIRPAPGLGLEVVAGARSGPADDTGWMQGLADPPAPDETAGHPATAEGEERDWSWFGTALERSPQLPAGPPDARGRHDVAVSVRYFESTDFEVRLESECPGHENIWDAYEVCEVAVRSTQECTNDPDGECPVEIDAFGGGTLELEGDLRTGYGVGSDVDELEELLDPLGTGSGESLESMKHAITDLHDHRRRERTSHLGVDAGVGPAVRKGDLYSMTAYQWVSLDAGVTVPEPARSRTERVSAHIGTKMFGSISIPVIFRRTECLTGPCCGWGECNCEVKLGLTLGANQLGVTAEGNSFTIKRPAGAPTEAGSSYHWELA